MADDSPGKVQALRAIFSEKNNPVMGMMPPGGKIPNRPWRAAQETTAAAQEPARAEDRKLNELKLGNNSNNKVLPVLLEKIAFNGDAAEKQNTNRLAHPKPAVGPKPPHLAQPPQRVANGLVHAQNGLLRPKDSGEKSFGETIASFMFASDKENEAAEGVRCIAPPLPPVPKPRISPGQPKKGSQSHVDLVNNLHNAQNGSQCCNIISSDNYICKSRVRRKALPPQEKLGPAPLKPVKPPHMKLPPGSSFSPSPAPASVGPLGTAPVLAQRPPPSLQRPSYRKLVI